jgi:hypothetical protein
MGTTCLSGFLQLHRILPHHPAPVSSFELPTRPYPVRLSHPLGLALQQSLPIIALPLLCSEVSRISLAMARILTIILSTSLALVNAVYAPIRFAETEYFEVATDKIQDLESSFPEILLSVRVAELALNYGKGYDSIHQLCTVSVPA